jgi:predicted ATPase/DNA-binding winged helix-turn-helix (wHTH) protein
MMSNSPHPEQRVSQDVISFGPFCLFAAERRLEKDGVPVHLGSRALDILLVLAEQATEVLSKKELIARAWPKSVTVEEGSLRFHIAALRRALGDGRSGVRYITNVSGRGYCLTAPTSRSVLKRSATQEITHSRLPARLVRMVGREDDVLDVSAKLVAQRFVTIVGPGGIGKTTVAVSIAHGLLSAFDGEVTFVDLGPLNVPPLVPNVIASALSLAANSENPVQALLNFLRERRMLLIVDSCEHLIQTVATLAETIFREAPQVHILATSRESLRVEGEQVYRLRPLGCPPADTSLTASEALSFPAVRLFVERVTAYGSCFELNDADAQVVGEICRRLDGIALALELAAGCVDAYGVGETAALLDGQFRLLRHGRRTALPRHQTLTATLDWSYNLLSEFERAVLRRLSIFVGPFSLEAAQSVAAGDLLEREKVLQAVGNLVAKSLVATGVGGVGACYRLLDTTRAYVSPKLNEVNEQRVIAQRHATYFRDLLERETRPLAYSPAGTLDAFREHVSNVRAALEWSFSAEGDIEIATGLAAASAPLLLELSLLAECRAWMERSIAALDDTNRDTLRELTLQAALGISLMFTKGNSEEARSANARGLTLAEELGDPYLQLRMLGQLNMFHHRAGDFRGALTFARRAEAVAEQMADRIGMAMANWMLCVSFHLVGNQASARQRCETALTRPALPAGLNVIRFGHEHRIRALSASARTLWLRGSPDQALRVARYAISEAESFGHSVYLCLSLCYTVSVFLWLGDWASAEIIIQKLIAEAAKHSLFPYHSDGLGLKGELSVKLGQTQWGVKLLRDWLERPSADRSQILTTVFATDLAEGLSTAGEYDEALTVVEQAIRQVEHIGDWFFLPEMLRIKGTILASAPQSNPSAAERCLLDSIDTAQRQSAVSWELRAATTLAQLQRNQGRFNAAKATLERVHDRFTEGFETVDLKAARCLLADLERQSCRTVGS